MNLLSLLQPNMGAQRMQFGSLADLMQPQQPWGQLPQQAPMPTPRPSTSGMAPGTRGEMRKGPDGKMYQYIQMTGGLDGNGDWEWHRVADEPPSNFRNNIRDIFTPEIGLPMAAAMMSGRTFGDSMAGAFQVAGEGLGKKREKNKTLEYLAKNHPDLAAMVEAGMPISEAWTAARKMSKSGGEDPSSVREWEYFNSLSKEDQARYLRMKRSSPYLDVGTGYVQPDPVNPGAVAGAPIIKENYQEAYDTGLGGEMGKNRASAAAALPGKVTMADSAVKIARDILADPNLPAYVGSIQGRMPSFSQGAVDFDAKVQQLRDIAFLDARQMLKGGGAITDFESQKAENAIARLNQAQSEAQFKAALTDFIDAVEQGKRKLEAAATGQTEAPVPGGGGVVDYRDYFGGQ